MHSELLFLGTNLSTLEPTSDLRVRLQFSMPEVKIERNDSIEIKKQILTMSTQERKRLGINKSTLWYQKKKLTEGKKINLYAKVSSRWRA